MNFERDKYYSQTELRDKYRGIISLSQIRSIIEAFSIPLIENLVTMYYDNGSYPVLTKYVLKSDWDKAVQNFRFG